MKKGYFLLGIFTVLIFILSSQVIQAKVSGKVNITFANSTLPSWNIEKQENGTIIYISDKHSKVPLICEQYPNAQNKNDLPSRNTYNKKDSNSKKGKEKPDKSSKKNDKIIQQKVNGIWSDCYQVNLGEDFIQIGDNSTIVVSQNYSSTDYYDDSGINTTFILEKFNGISYNFEPNTIWIKTEEECASLGKNGLCFGATDNSMLDGQLGMFRYEIASTKQLYVKNISESSYSYPMFYTNYSLPTWGEQQQIYSFEDICSKDYSNCQWTVDNDTAIITFVSDKYIDPTVFPGGNGSASNPYQITNCTYLQAMNESLTSYFILMNNISCSGINFTPIRLGSAFTGNLNGQGYTISNLNINSPGNNKVGLFSILSGAGTVSNLNIVNANVTADYYVGILTGSMTGGTINNVSVSGSVTGTTATGEIGGLTGAINSGTISNSYVINSIITETNQNASYIGGFIGYIVGGTIFNDGVNNTIIIANDTGNTIVGGFAGRNEFLVSNSYASNISVFGGGGGGAGYIGGFIGQTPTASANITNSWSSGLVNSNNGSFTGGFVGRSASSLINCYSIVNVTSSSDNVGGFLGYNTGSVINSYSSGLVTRTTAGSFIGGLVGRNTGTVTSSYYDNQTSNQSDTGKGLGLTTALMKQRNSFVSWDFITIWSIIENITYPYINLRFPASIINFVFPTPVNNSTQTNNNIFVNVSSYDPNNYTHYVLTDFNRSLYLWWRMENTNTSSLFDDSTYNNTGVCAGSCPISTTGKFGNGEYFNGSGPQQKLVISNFPSATDVSVSMWINTAQYNVLRGIFTFGQSTGLNNLYLHTNSVDGKLRLINYNSTGSTVLSLSKVINNNQWYFITATTNLTTGCLYVDSVMINCSAMQFGTNFSKSTMFYIGSLSTGSYWNGSMDEVTVWKRTLSQSEINSLYNATVNQYSNNFVNLSLGNYTFQSSSVNSLGNMNETEIRMVTITNITNDTIPPNATLLTPLNNSYKNTDQNFTFNATDDYGLSNATIYIYNSTGLVNSTIISFIGSPLQAIGGIVIHLLDGIYSWFVTVFDASGNNITTSNFTLIIDTRNPQISFVPPTSLNNSYRDRNYILANVTFFDVNFKNMTVTLYNSTGLVSSTSSNVSPYYINISSLPDGVYYLNASITDLAGNINNTETRIITLDTHNPNITLISPANNSYNTTAIQSFSANVSDNIGVKNVTLFIYNSTGLYNSSTITYPLNTLSINVSISNMLLDNTYTWFYQAFDWAGNNFTSENRTITIDTRNPSLSITYPANGSKYNTSVSVINYTASDINYNQCWYSTNNGVTNSTKVTYGNNFTNITSVEGNNTWTIWCNDLAGNSNSSSVTFYKDTVNPILTVLEPQGETFAVNQNVYFGVYAYDLNNISFIGATVKKPDNTTDTVIMNGMLNSSDFQNQMGFLEANVGPGQTCTGMLTGSSAITTILGDGTPQPDNTCSLIGNRSVFGDFDSIMYYALNNLSLDSAVNFEIVSGVPTSANAVDYAYIGRTNFAGEGDKYEVYGTDMNTSGFLIKQDTNDTYGAMRVKRVNNTFSFYVLNNTDSSWILLGTQVYSFTNVFFLVESEDIANDFGTASVNWTNYSITTSPNYYLGIYKNTSQPGFYNVTFFTNDTFGNGVYAYSNFILNQSINYPPSTPFVLTPIAGGLYNKNLTISWSQVIDANNDAVTFNISLLNSDFTFNKTIIANYGNLSTTNYVWDTSGTPDGNYSIKIEVIETLTPEHYNQTDTLSGYFTLHNTPPSFNTIPANASIDYQQSLSVQFNISDSINITSIITNDSRFAISNSGLLTNTTSLSAGIYIIRITATDILNNTNSIIYQITVNKIVDTPLLIVTPISPISYGIISNFTCIANSSVELYINGINKTSENGVNIVRPMGSYSLVCTSLGNQNYTGASTNASIYTVTASIDYVFTPTLNTHLVSTPMNITSYCYDSNFDYCNVNVNCSISIFYQNSTIMFNKAVMSREVNDYIFNLNSLDTSVTGNYNGLVRCSDGIQTRTSAFTYVISTTGNNINDDLNNIVNYTLIMQLINNRTDIVNYTLINQLITNRNDIVNYTLINQLIQNLNITDMTNYSLIMQLINNRTDIVNYTLINEGIWNFPNRTITNINMSNVNFTGVNVSTDINYALINQGVWSYVNVPGNTTLGYYIWNYGNRTLSFHLDVVCPYDTFMNHNMNCLVTAKIEDPSTEEKEVNFYCYILDTQTNLNYSSATFSQLVNHTGVTMSRDFFLPQNWINNTQLRLQCEATYEIFGFSNTNKFYTTFVAKEVGPNVIGGNGLYINQSILNPNTSAGITGNVIGMTNTNLVYLFIIIGLFIMLILIIILMAYIFKKRKKKFFYRNV